MFKKSPKKDFVTMLVLVLIVVLANLAFNMAGHRWHPTLFTLEIGIVLVFMLGLIIKRAVTGAYKNKTKEKDEVELSEDGE